MLNFPASFSPSYTQKHIMIKDKMWVTCQEESRVRGINHYKDCHLIMGGGSKLFFIVHLLNSTGNTEWKTKNVMILKLCIFLSRLISRTKHQIYFLSLFEWVSLKTTHIQSLDLLALLNHLVIQFLSSLKSSLTSYYVPSMILCDWYLEVKKTGQVFKLEYLS